ncbi:hypothetical protein LTZ17_00830 [Lacticaseibacillus casei]|uniref:hypothetical protein n=1 Tax=Lacticaseibacillus casei TaxID=1582 RepID=UPI00237D7C27|nr:hypothetical protein [Lacticaseibacillus casei]MDE3281238.1 hypothetical protein [Lacticaseibacillus casei]
MAVIGTILILLLAVQALVIVLALIVAGIQTLLSLWPSTKMKRLPYHVRAGTMLASLFNALYKVVTLGSVI